ncbi:ABC transporter substrate-binding protein [Natronococcus occultus]|uniref:Family 5 extracellular solute-binding protein n=1 Tax=Natronococcus occultus SP4 TaxID=694430 RepID=L0JZK5_9EURY|nr:ABC transporter substrate-binding protein [Natronococcus occultus]AGB37534.1 family 5 extracellular solute-binding protein [Natronococcus occultus SP4]
MDDVGSPTTRRGILAGTATGIAGSLAGCTERLWSRAENPGPEQVSLTIKAVPADDDIVAAKIASQLRENLEAAGIDATFEPIAKAELYRDILLEDEYDVFVARHSGLDEYDALRGLLHSRYANERGWQNPFQFSNVTVDDLLETQLTATGEDRERALAELFEHLTETVPYTTVAFPSRIGAAREPLSESISGPPYRPLDYLEILSQESEDGPRERPLEVGVFGEGLTDRLNPLVVDSNRVPALLELLYEPLAYRTDDGLIGWLAEDVEWSEGALLEATVTLRADHSWHDGRSLDADDVAFTYRFLRDTSLGEAEGGVPAPRYRGRQRLVESVEAVDSRTVEFSFRTTNRETALRAFRIPVLPAHIWEPRSAVVGDRQTEALVDDNEEPIGSGLFELAAVTDDTEVELELFTDHVFYDDDRPSLLEGFPQYEGIRFAVAPNSGAVVDLLEDEEIDLTGTPLPADETALISDLSGRTVLTERTDEFYMIGYNSHHEQLGNPHFRRLLSRLLDREHAVDELFAGFAEPARTVSSLFGLRDSELAVEESEITAFPGSDGAIDSERVRSLFEDENYRYEDGALLE